MPFEKGNTYSLGRPKGSQNIISGEVKKALHKTCMDAISRLELEELSQDQLIKVIQVSAGYITPKLRDTEIEVTSNLETFIDKVMSVDGEELHNKLMDGFSSRPN